MNKENGQNILAALKGIRGRQRHTGENSAPLQKRDLQKTLERICISTGVPESERRAVIENLAMNLNGRLFAFKLEEWTGFVKVYVDIGLPSPDSANDIYRSLLEQQLYIPAPFSVIYGVHPESKHVVLCACAPLPRNEEADVNFVEFLHGCATVAALVKSDQPEMA